MENRNNAKQVSLSFKAGSKKEVVVVIEGNRLCIQGRHSYDELILFKDFLGCSLSSTRGKTFKSIFKIFFFLKTHKSNGLIKRKIKCVELEREGNGQVVEFKKQVMQYFYANQKERLVVRTDRNKGEYYKKALIVLDPISNKKKGVKVLNKYSQYLKSNGIVFTVNQCKNSLAVREYIKGIDKQTLFSYDLIICISNDNYVHSVLNGFYERNDIVFSKQFLTVSMLPISENCSLVANFLKETKTETSLANALYLICHFNKTQLNLSEYQFIGSGGDKRSVYSFSNLTYGFLADIQVPGKGKEGIGKTAKKLVETMEVFKLKSQPIKIWYPKLNEILLPEIEKKIDNVNEFIFYENNVFFVLSSNLPYITKNQRTCPNIEWRETDNVNLQIYEREKRGRLNFGKFLINYDKYDPNKKSQVRDELVDNFRLELDGEHKNIVIDGESYASSQIKLIQKQKNDKYFFTLI